MVKILMVGWPCARRAPRAFTSENVHVQHLADALWNAKKGIVELFVVDDTQKVEEVGAEKEHMEHALETAQQDPKCQFEQQRETFARNSQETSVSPSPRVPRISQEVFTVLPDEEKAIVRDSLVRWR